MSAHKPHCATNTLDPHATPDHAVPCTCGGSTEQPTPTRAEAERVLLTLDGRGKEAKRAMLDRLFVGDENNG